MYGRIAIRPYENEMDDLLTKIKTAIKADATLAYLQAVEVIEEETFVPEEPGFPLVGLIDGGTVPSSMPGKKDKETLTVGIVAFQSIALDEPGASIMGSTQHGKGVIGIGKDLKTLLNDNYLSLTTIHFAHLGRIHPARPMEAQKGFIVYKRFDFEYRRYV